MDDASQWLEFVRLPTFERQAKGLLSEEDVRRLELKLNENPTAGAVMAGTGGVRKVRFAVGSAGKSGSLRIIYYLRNAKGRIYLITAYAKSAKDNLSKAERNAMWRLAAILDGEI